MNVAAQLVEARAIEANKWEVFIFARLDVSDYIHWNIGVCDVGTFIQNLLVDGNGRMVVYNLLLGMSFLLEGDIALYLATRQAQFANLEIRPPHNWSDLDLLYAKQPCNRSQRGLWCACNEDELRIDGGLCQYGPRIYVKYIRSGISRTLIVSSKSCDSFRSY